MVPTQPHPLVDHYFRHESARLIAVLTGRLGVRHFPLAEDAVQVALTAALSKWSMHGVPDEPTGWLLRVATNHAIDVLRRESRKFELTADQGEVQTRPPATSLDDELQDSLLRMIFACCDPRIPAESQTALALKTLCGFSTREIARALLSTSQSIEKRISRAKRCLCESKLELDDLTAEAMADRLPSVQHVVYLLFNEGYSSTRPDDFIRVELCEEAVRLALLLAESDPTCGSASSAFLALLLFHSARLDARLDQLGGIVLFDDQDIRRWDLRLLKEAFRWFERATSQPVCTRYHAEAMIAAEHSRGKLTGVTDWDRIVSGYDLLCRLSPSSVHQLNRAIAIAHRGDVDSALRIVDSLDCRSLEQRYHLWHAARGALMKMNGRFDEAVTAYQNAWELAPTTAEKELICRKIDGVK